MVNLKYLQKLLFLLLMEFSLGFVCACSDDKKEPGNEHDNKTNRIAGKWKDEDKIMILGNDGSYFSDIENQSYSERKGTYSYNEKQNLLTVNVVAIPNQNSAYRNTYIVESLTLSTLVLLYTDGDVEGYYTRVK